MRQLLVLAICSNRKSSFLLFSQGERKIMISDQLQKRGRLFRHVFFVILVMVSMTFFPGYIGAQGTSPLSSVDEPEVASHTTTKVRRNMLLVPIYIEEGTSLIQLAKKYCTSKYHWQEIARINHLAPPYRIYEGDTVEIPFELLKKEIASAQVASVVGDVFRLQGSDGSLRQVKKGERMRPGETLITGENGFAHLVLSDNRYIRVSKNSQFTFTYLFRLTDNSLKAEFFLESGNVSVDVRKKLRKNETLRTRTPVSVTGVRGTSFRVKMDGDINVIETLRGRVALSAAGTMLMVDEGKGSVVKEGEPPAAPQDLPAAPSLPAMNKVYREQALRIPSPQVDGVRCRLRICTDEAGEQTVWSGETSKGEDFLVVGLADGEYYAFFTAINAVGLEGAPSVPSPFLLRTVPGTPVLSSHYDGRQIFDPAVEFRWLKGEGDAHYRVQVARDDEFTDLLAEKDVEETEYTFQHTAPGVFYFRVQAVADDGFCSNYSRADRVEIKEMPDFGPIPPASSGEPSVLHWPTMGAGVFYDIEIARDKKFRRVVESAAQLPDAVYTPKPLEPGTYWIRMRAVLPSGVKSPWVSPRELTVAAPELGVADAIVFGVFLTIIFL